MCLVVTLKHVVDNEYLKDQDAQERLTNVSHKRVKYRVEIIYSLSYTKMTKMWI
jgi:hypothetical protein